LKQLLELIETSAEKGPAGDLLREHREGIHHIAREVEDLDKIFREISAQGAKFLWDRIIERWHTRRISWLKSKEFNGVHVELKKRH
jgi:4-hydroxyphenylpyruvate dioxygenase-like putative hemolysin